ncbi:MAG TPA: pectinesterase family protein [Verrucomicrobiae bacterium]|nr:pectinesterase family protein [Verrucomicrobiae bacterium]
MKTIICLIALVASIPVSATTLFVPSQYSTVQAAINAAPAGTANNRTIIYIAPGTYKELITVPQNKPYLCLIGQTSDGTKVTLTYNLNATSPNGSGGTVGTSGSASVRVNAPDFIAKNITFQNASHDDIAQAVAMLTYADRLAFSNCWFFGFQDTLWVANGRQYFVNCHITGDTDFIFGNATALFASCYLNESGVYGFHTAPNTASNTAVGLVFKYCALTGNPNTAIDPTTGTRYSTVTAVANNRTYLGRPWQYATTKPSCTYISCKMGPHIINVGWNPWDSGNTNPSATTRFSEYGSTDLNGNALNLSQRVSWSHILTSTQAARYSTANIFGPASYWGSGYVNWGGTYVAWNPVAALVSVPAH